MYQVSAGQEFTLFNNCIDSSKKSTLTVTKYTLRKITGAKGHSIDRDDEI